MATEDQVRAVQEAEMLLHEMDIPTTQTNLEQMGVFVEAFRTFVERNAEYKDLWRDYGEDIKLHIRSKLLRLDKTGREDDAIDLIVYTAFWLRLKREGIL